MKFEGSIEKQGLSQLNDRLAALDVQTQDKVLRQALMFGLTAIVRRAKDKAPVGDGEGGHYRDAIRKSSVKATGSRNATAGIRLATGKGQKGWLWRFLEFGTEPYPIRNRKGGDKTALADVVAGKFFGKNVQHPGISARPHLRPAFDEGKAEALDRFAQKMGRAIDKALQ